MHQHGAVLVRQFHQRLEEAGLDALGRWIVRERGQDHCRLLAGSGVDVRDAVEELVGRGHRNRDLPPVGHDHAPLVDRVRRVRHRHGVARADRREREVRQGVLGAHGRDGLRVRVERDAEVGGVPLADLLSQLRYPARERVPVVALVLGRLGELVDHRARRRAVGIAHAEVDDVEARAAGLGPHRVDFRENVLGELPYAVEGLPVEESHGLIVSVGAGARPARPVGG